jgi:hypothetical protein
MTKGLSLHGLGLYIYSGEDLPEGEEAAPKAKATLDNTRLLTAIARIKDGTYTTQKLRDAFALTDEQDEMVVKALSDA